MPKRGGKVKVFSKKSLLVTAQGQSESYEDCSSEGSLRERGMVMIAGSGHESATSVP